MPEAPWVSCPTSEHHTTSTRLLDMHLQILSKFTILLSIFIIWFFQLTREYIHDRLLTATEYDRVTFCRSISRCEIQLDWRAIWRCVATEWRGSSRRSHPAWVPQMNTVLAVEAKIFSNFGVIFVPLSRIVWWGANIAMGPMQRVSSVSNECEVSIWFMTNFHELDLVMTLWDSLAEMDGKLAPSRL